MIFTIIIAIFLAYTLYKLTKRYLLKPTFKGQHIWITGASSGIGEYLAYEFNKYQAFIIISARNIKELERVQASCKFPENVQVEGLDMMDYGQVREVTGRIVGELEAKGKRLDVVVENAGVSMRCLFENYHFNNHLALFNVNVNGPFQHIQALLPHFIKNKSGHIVGITSASGKLATSHRSSYAGSKSALIGILDSLRSELHGSGIAVTNIMPGYVRTNLSKNAMTSGQSQKLGFTDKNIENGLDPKSFANTAVRAIYNKEKELQISGTLLIPVMIVLRNLCPDLVFWLMRRNAKSQAEAIAKDKTG